MVLFKVTANAECLCTSGMHEADPIHRKKPNTNENINLIINPYYFK